MVVQHDLVQVIVTCTRGILMAQDKGPLYLEQTQAIGYFGAVRSREKLQCAEHVCASEKLEPNLIDPASDHICYLVQLPLQVPYMNLQNPTIFGL